MTADTVRRVQDIRQHNGAKSRTSTRRLVGVVSYAKAS